MGCFPLKYGPVSLQIFATKHLFSCRSIGMRTLSRHPSSPTLTVLLRRKMAALFIRYDVSVLRLLQALYRGTIQTQGVTYIPVLISGRMICEALQVDWVLSFNHPQKVVNIHELAVDNQVLDHRLLFSCNSLFIDFFFKGPINKFIQGNASFLCPFLSCHLEGIQDDLITGYSAEQ